MKKYFIHVKVGFFLALRQVRRSSWWTTVLIVFVMTLTFLNLVVVSGILVGLIEGAVGAVRTHYTGDLTVTTLREKTYIINSPSVIKKIESLPETEDFSARYVESGTIEANYKTKTRQDELPEQVGTLIAGIDPEAEDRVTNLRDLVIEGEYLDADDYDQVMIGALLLDKYLQLDSPGFLTLKNVGIGDRVRIKVNDHVREVKIKGILKSKVDEVDRRVFLTETQLREMIGRDDFNVDEISIKLKAGSDPVLAKKALLASGVDEFGKVQTFEEGQPKFLKDIKDTFRTLGNFISSIGLAVAAITVFIVIFINAITRRKFIGILKGIGISGGSIEISYIFQSIFYALIGVILGTLLTYLILVPYFQANPINFPFSDGILVAPPLETFFRAVLLTVATIIAGYIPSRIIIRKNTLDSILGRN